MSHTTAEIAGGHLADDSGGKPEHTRAARENGCFGLFHFDLDHLGSREVSGRAVRCVGRDQFCAPYARRLAGTETIQVIRSPVPHHGGGFLLHPPESIKTSRVEASSAMKSKYPADGMICTPAGSPESPAPRG